MYHVVSSILSFPFISRISVISVVGCLCFCSCEKNQDTLIDQGGLPPSISFPSVTPSAVNSDTINVGQERLPDDLLSIPLSVKAHITPSAFSAIKSASFVYFQDPQFPLYSGGLHDDGTAPDLIAHDSVYSGTIPLTIARSQIGTYYVELMASDAYGNESNIVRIPFTIVRLNQPPIVSNLIAPDTVHTSASQSFLITVIVQDPDGLADVRSVTRTTPGGNVWPLNDNGVNGDAAKGDGIFSETVSLDPPPTPGPYTFKFQAFDRSNAPSNFISHTIVVLQ